MWWPISQLGWLLGKTISPDPVIDGSISKYEKMGLLITNGAKFPNEEGKSWDWCVEQFDGFNYWYPDEYNNRVAVRRKSWPIMHVRKEKEGIPNYKNYWHVWAGDWGRRNPKYGPRFHMGWGGVLGANTEPDDWVLVNGKKTSTGGIGWIPTEEDKEANDWERIDSWERS
jgi:hypothetical protein